jgi:hypothetical protein
MYLQTLSRSLLSERVNNEGDAPSRLTRQTVGSETQKSRSYSKPLPHICNVLGIDHVSISLDDQRIDDLLPRHGRTRNKPGNNQKRSALVADDAMQLTGSAQTAAWINLRFGGSSVSFSPLGQPLLPFSALKGITLSQARVGCLPIKGSHVPQHPAPGSMTIPTSPSSSVQRNPPFTTFAEKLPPLVNARKIEVLGMAEDQRSSAIRREALDAERQTEVLKA